ncbi:hypothetical protein E8E11_011046 [Didymella keratinophila]|nr:hypothetical protein E8E11_011046 [Didymella keratinophila]
MLLIRLRMENGGNWYKFRRRPWIPEATQLATDIELLAPSRSAERGDSGISISGLTLVSEEGPEESTLNARSEEPIYLKLDFGDRTYTKPLEYNTFSRWSAMKEFKISLERDGLSIKGLWDEVEKMKVCGGDWDARPSSTKKVLDTTATARTLKLMKNAGSMKYLINMKKIGAFQGGETESSKKR